MTTDPNREAAFWEQPQLVERFAARAPDVRLMELVERVPEPSEVRVLDLGCAGGRNTVPLAERGFDVCALDASRAMVARTRARLEPILGAEEAGRRVIEGRMEDLRRFPDRHFRWVLGLGVFHQAPSPEAWQRAISEATRVLESNGLLLYASFHPETAPEGAPGRPVPGQSGMYAGFRSGSLYLIGPEALDRRLTALGLVPETHSVTVRVETQDGVRVTVNGLFRRALIRAPD